MYIIVISDSCLGGNVFLQLFCTECIGRHKRKKRVVIDNKKEKTVWHVVYIITLLLIEREGEIYLINVMYLYKVVV